MAIRRLTIELDDSQDILTKTASPPSLLPKKENLQDGIQSTSTPQEQDSYRKQESGQEGAHRITETIGRTPSDLVFAFINRPEFIATALTVLSFLIFVTKLQQLKDFWLPLGASAILNIVWFGLVGIRQIPWFRKQ